MLYLVEGYEQRPGEPKGLGLAQDGGVRPSSARDLPSCKPLRALATMMQALYEERVIRTMCLHYGEHQ